MSDNRVLTYSSIDLQQFQHDEKRLIVYLERENRVVKVAGPSV